MKQTRREMIKHLVGVFAGVGSVGVTKGAPSSRNKIRQNQPSDRAKMTSQNPDMCLVPPGFSMSTFIMNIPQLMQSDSSTPTIIMDRYDLERLRGRIVSRIQGDIDTEHKSQSQRLAMMFNQLHQQSAIELVDYQQYYREDIQRKNIKRTRKILSSTSEYQNIKNAVDSANRFAGYGFGEYQSSLRKALDNLDRFDENRKLIESEANKLESGTGDEELWNERVANQYLAALEVRRNLERELNCDIQCIGQQESDIVASLFSDVTIKRLPPTLQYNQDKITNIFYEFDVDDTTKDREVSNEISSIAQDIVGIDDDGWFVFGPRLAMLESGDIYSRARSHVRFNSIRSIATEADELLSRLEKHREENKSVEFLNYEVEHMVERNNLSPIEKRRFHKQLQAETELYNYSRDLDELSQDYSPAARIVVESILVDPLNRYTYDDVYQEAVDLKRMLKPTQLSQEQLDTFLDRGGYKVGFEDRRDWNQYANRQAATP